MSTKVDVLLAEFHAFQQQFLRRVFLHLRLPCVLTELNNVSKLVQLETKFNNAGSHVSEGLNFVYLLLR